MASGCCLALRPSGALPAISLATPSATAVRVVVVANFENGADFGDKPGEYQFWVEREHLDETLKVRGAKGVVRRNKQGLYGLLLENLTPFLLDPRFEFDKTYWLFTGISGADPEVASVGSAAWARYEANYRVGAPVVRELLKDWSRYRNAIPQAAFK
jgi:purine nucleoside permease